MDGIKEIYEGKLNMNQNFFWEGKWYARRGSDGWAWLVFIPCDYVAAVWCSSLGFSVSITMSEQVVHPSVVQRIIIKFLTTESVKPAEILHRFKAHSGRHV